MEEYRQIDLKSERETSCDSILTKRQTGTRTETEKSKRARDEAGEGPKKRNIAETEIRYGRRFAKVRFSKSDEI